MRRLSLGLVVALALTACGEPTRTTPTVRGLPIAGNHQVGDPGTVLPAPLELEVEDDAGRPIAGMRVRWRALRNGSVEDPDLFTDATGRARARFRLGDEPGSAVAEAKLANADLVIFSLEARDPAGTRELPLDQIVALTVPTYDGSGQVVHPDHALTPGWVLPRQLAITPYPNGNPGFENPSLYGGRVGDDWEPPAGGSNPVVRPPANGYLSDPDIVWIAETGELWLYYRQVTGRNEIYLIRSTDGVRWSSPELVVAAPNHQIISPAVARRSPNDWLMWSINGGPLGCNASATHLELRRSTDGRNWSKPEPLALAHGSLTPWHLEVQWLPTRNEFWALYNVKQPGGCATPALFLATSTDGETWSPMAAPVLVKGRTPAFQDIVYRSTFSYRPGTDDVLLWYSGARFQGGRWVWAAAVERRTRAGLFENRAQPLMDKLSVPAPAELDDWP
jgi:hypothetical protein